MLTDADIEFMYETRQEIIAKRRRDITVVYFETVEDEFTGEPISEEKKDREVLSVVTEVASDNEAGADRKLSNGIYIDRGDLWFSIDIELVNDIADKITQITHDGKDYEILGMDKKGIGKRNRFEFLARVIN